MRVCLFTAAALVVSLAQSIFASYSVNGTGPDGEFWEFEMAGTNGGRMGTWIPFDISEFSNSGDSATYEYFTPGYPDVTEYVAEDPSGRSKIGTRLKFRFEEAVDYCRSVHNASVVSIRNRQERNFVISILPNNRHGFWLGLQRNPMTDPAPERYTSFQDGTPVTYYSWGPGEPTGKFNEECVYQGINNGNPSYWVDADCTLKRRAVCKRLFVPRTNEFTTTSTEEPRRPGTPVVGVTAPPIDDYGACYVNDADPTAQQSRMSIPFRNGQPGNSYLLRNYTEGGDLGVDPALLHFAEPFCCYKYVSVPKETFESAEQKCQAWGASMPSEGGEGHLVRVVDPLMNMFLYRMKLEIAGTRSPNDRPWIGARSRNGRPEWIDERQFDGASTSPGWEPWFEGQPDGDRSNERCMMMGGSATGAVSTSPSFWSDGNCNEKRQYFCQYCSISDHTESPTSNPTDAPTALPTAVPTAIPTVNPTISPTYSPTSSPSISPTKLPSRAPSCTPTPGPTRLPSLAPSGSPTANRSICSAFGYVEYSGPEGSGYSHPDSFCCYKHISPAAGNRKNFTDAQEKCESLGARVATESGHAINGRGALARVLGPAMNQFLARVVYQGNQRNTEDRSWIAARRDLSEFNVSLLGDSSQTDMWVGPDYPWADGQPSGVGQPLNRFDPLPTEECISLGDGTRDGVDRWNDAECSSRRQLFCQYCYVPDDLPTPATLPPPSETANTVQYDCGNPLSEAPTQQRVTLPARTTTTVSPTTPPTITPSTNMPTSQPTIHQGYCARGDGWIRYPGNMSDLGYTGRHSEQGYCCYKYFSAENVRLAHDEAEAICQILGRGDSFNNTGGFVSGEEFPGEGHLAFAASRKLNDFLYSVRQNVPGSSEDKSWLAGSITMVNGAVHVDPGTTTIGGNNTTGQEFVDRLPSGLPDYPWYSGEPSIEVNAGAGDGGVPRAENCVQMGKGNRDGEAPNLWNDAVCTKKRPYFCQYCYLPPDPFTGTPTTSEPTSSPTNLPSNIPSSSPTDSPSASPSTSPSVTPTISPTFSTPTSSPSVSPTISPTLSPTVLSLCSEATIAGAVLRYASQYGDRWAQTCWGIARTDPTWLCDCFLVMKPFERETLFPNMCRLADVNSSIDALAAFDNLLNFTSTGSSLTCPGYSAPEPKTVCTNIKCSNDCRLVSNGGIVPDGGTVCGWSSKRNKCKEGAFTRANELDRGQCAQTLEQLRCESYTCGRLCFANRGHQDQPGAVGCGWSSKKYKCLYGARTRPDEMNAGYCNA